MWFLAILLFVVWLTAFISFGASAYWVHVLLLLAIVLPAMDRIRSRGRTS